MNAEEGYDIFVWSMKRFMFWVQAHQQKIVTGSPEFVCTFDNHLLPTKKVTNAWNATEMISAIFTEIFSSEIVKACIFDFTDSAIGLPRLTDM